MTAIRRSFGVGTVLVLLLGLAACTASGPEPPAPTSPVVQLGAPGEPNETLSPEDAAKQLETPKFVEAHSEFMLDMIAHHDLTAATGSTSRGESRAGAPTRLRPPPDPGDGR